MSNKNLLNEATIRRFMKLANMEPLTSPFVDRLEEMHCPSGGRDNDEPMEEAAHEDDLDERAKYGGNKGDESRSKRDYMEEGASDELVEQITKRVAARILKSALLAKK